MNIKQLLELGHGPVSISRQLRVTVDAVVAVIQDCRMVGWGSPQKLHLVLSRKRAWERAWPEPDLLVLAEARLAHDQGRISMVQAREGDYIIQYAVPVISQPRAAWFTAPKETY